MPDFTAPIVFTGIVVGRCKSKGCAHVTRMTGMAVGRGICPDHGKYGLREVIGSYNPDVNCGAKCRNAIGGTCECSCGGANHGCNH